MDENTMRNVFGQRIQAAVVRAMLGNDVMQQNKQQLGRLGQVLKQRNTELARLITGSAARSAAAQFAQNEELRKAVSGSTSNLRLVDPKTIEAFRLLNNRSFASALSKAAAPGIAEAMRGFYDFRLPLITEQLKPVLARFRELWEQSLPPNWDGCDDPDEVERLVGFMEETGWCLLWTPRWSVIEALVVANADVRADVLHAHEDGILADLESCLSEVGQLDLRDLRVASAEAIQAYRNGTVIPAQTAATTVLTTAINVHFGIASFRKAREKFGEKEAMKVGIQQFRLRAILRVAYHAIAEFHGRPGESMPVRYNRNASTHRVSQAQFNKTNALVALMLIVPLMRELDCWFARKATEETDAA